MHLLLRRSQRDDGWIFSSMIFLLDAQLDLTPDEQELFEKYDLLSHVVYDSDAREQYAHAAIERFEAATKPTKPIPIFEPSAADIASQFSNIASMLWNSAVGATYGLISDLSLRITLGTLIDGQHFESESLEEMLTVEDNIKQATEYLANYLHVALTFDGREDLSEL